MERITRGMLERKVREIQALGHADIQLDHHQPGGNRETWAVEDLTGSRRLGYSGRMTVRECFLYLCGIIYTLEYQQLHK